MRVGINGSCKGQSDEVITSLYGRMDSEDNAGAMFHCASSLFEHPYTNVPTFTRTKWKTLGQIILPFSTFSSTLLYLEAITCFTNLSVPLRDDCWICQATLKKIEQVNNSLATTLKLKRFSKNWMLFHNSLGTKTWHDLIQGYWQFLFISLSTNTYTLSGRNVTVFVYRVLPRLQRECWVVNLVAHDSLWPHGLKHARPPCPSPTPRVYPDSCPLSW